MRKKKIIEQNVSLFKQIDSLKGEIEKLTKKAEEQAAEIERLKRENEALAPKEVSSPIESVKEKVLKAAFNAEEYGAKAIGKIVVAASGATAALAKKEGTERIEIVNLILGKAEVSKADILNAVSKDTDENQKRIEIDSIVGKTCDYFDKTVK